MKKVVFIAKRYNIAHRIFHNLGNLLKKRGFSTQFFLEEDSKAFLTKYYDGKSLETQGKIFILEDENLIQIFDFDIDYRKILPLLES
jgi:hypothetical protein